MKTPDSKYRGQADKIASLVHRQGNLRDALSERIELALLEARRDAIESVFEATNSYAPDCGDNSCAFAVKKGGMRTNGGCRCFSGRSILTSPKLEQYAYRLKQALTQGEAMKDEEIKKAAEEYSETVFKHVLEGKSAEEISNAILEATRPLDGTQDAESIWDGDFTRQWLALSPALADIDLRGILYVSREHASIITPEDKLSSDASGLLEALLTTPDTALDHLEQLKPLSRTEKSIMMLRVLERAKPVQVWGTPPILNACMALAKAEPELGSQLYAFLKDRPSGQIQASLVPKIRDEAWAVNLFQNWTDDPEISAPVKNAIKELNKAKKV